LPFHFLSQRHETMCADVWSLSFIHVTFDFSIAFRHLKWRTAEDLRWLKKNFWLLRQFTTIQIPVAQITYFKHEQLHSWKVFPNTFYASKVRRVKAFWWHFFALFASATSLSSSFPHLCVMITLLLFARAKTMAKTDHKTSGLCHRWCDCCCGSAVGCSSCCRIYRWRRICGVAGCRCTVVVIWSLNDWYERCRVVYIAIMSH
jgi:hypothetical protein